eukprot:1142642-Pelagomonas_calceolata.AAC.1
MHGKVLYRGEKNVSDRQQCVAINGMKLSFSPRLAVSIETLVSLLIRKPSLNAWPFSACLFTVKHHIAHFVQPDCQKYCPSKQRATPILYDLCHVCLVLQLETPPVMLAPVPSQHQPLSSTLAWDV